MQNYMDNKILTTRPGCICANERVKMVGAIDGFFPDMGGHIEREMGGLWIPPVKLLDGFWMKMDAEPDAERPRVARQTMGVVDFEREITGKEEWLVADRFEGFPWKNVFYYDMKGLLGGISVVRTDLAPDPACGIIVSYEIYNGKEQEVSLSLSFLARANLRPEWLGERAGMRDGEDEAEYDEEQKHFHVYDRENPWHLLLGTDAQVERTGSGQFFGPEVNIGGGISCQMDCRVCIPAGESRQVRFFAAGSCESLADCLEQERLLRLPADYEKEKRSRYEALFEVCALCSGDEDFDRTFQWIKAHTDWMIHRHGPVGRGITAGLPDFRWWFGCDSFYTIQGLLPLGLSDLARETLQLLLEYSRKINGNGQVIHELLSNEVCPHPGNVQETAQFVTTIWQYYQWTGDRGLVEEAWDYCRMAVEWLRQRDDDGDGFPTGYGLIEICGLNMEMIDCAVYTCQAYDSFAHLADLMGDERSERAYRELAGWLGEKINRDFWEEEQGLYCDCMANQQMIRSVKKEVMRRAGDSADPEIVRYLEEKLERRAAEEEMGKAVREEGWLVNRNSIIDVPMETQIADQDKAIRALDRMYSEEFVGKYGVFLDSLGKRQCMTITTGIMAVAQANYGYSDRALDLVKRMFSNFSRANPNCISEYSPDGGCMVQAWTLYGAVVPLVRHFFGIRPDASRKEILIQPQLPTGWENVSLENVPLLDGAISISFTREGKEPCMWIKNTTSAAIKVSETWGGNVKTEGP